MNDEVANCHNHNTLKFLFYNFMTCLLTTTNSLSALIAQQLWKDSTSQPAFGSAKFIKSSHQFYIANKKNINLLVMVPW